MTRKQIVLIIAVNALISALISIAVATLVNGPELVTSRLLGRPISSPAEATPGGPEPSPAAGSQEAEALPTSSAVYHTVESGDTLLALALRYEVTAEDIATANGLDNPDAIQEGMILLIPIGGIPEPSATPPPMPTSPSTPTMPFEPPSVQTAEAAGTVLPSRTPLATATLPQVEISQIVEPGDAEQEGVVLTNVGAGLADLGDWTLSDGGANQYVFARLTLWPEGSITVYSRAGVDSADSLYWGKGDAIWSPGKTATLKDAEGNTVATYTLEP